MRYLAYVASLIGTFASILLLPTGGGWALTGLAIFGFLALLGTWDLIQSKHSLRRNYPVLANLRFLLEEVRPEIRQYFLESDMDGVPFNRNKRAIVYQRAKKELDKRPFGTLQNVYGDGYEWLTHSIEPAAVSGHDFRTKVGGPGCSKPYLMSLFNISAMSFGSLSANAIRALNKGAKLGGFAHDTGEGSFSKHHREFGGDIVWQIASGYFGCRHPDGTFCEEKFAETAVNPQVKMIEVKISQGAKPGHGGVLPGAKVSPEISAARGVPMGIDCISPPRHSAFSTPIEMMRFIQTLRELSGGKPVGFKLCIGHPVEFMSICKAMIETGITPDFIIVDGKEGGTGAAPLEFTDHLGTPLREALSFVHNCLVGAGLRESIRIGASGRVITAFDIVRMLALGADWCNAARGFMFALGCVQSLSCHTDTCPTGIATQNLIRQKALVVPDKAERVRAYHQGTLEALAELVAAAGYTHPADITRDRLMRRVEAGAVMSFAEVYPELKPGELLSGSQDRAFAANWAAARADSFAPRALARV
jgi:glutamate synthase domain-containing protein 2